MRSIVGASAGLLLAIAGPVHAQETVVEGPLGARLDSTALGAAATGFHGNVLVVSRGTVILHKGYGLANEATRTPYSPATLVQIGSNVKDFTKVAIYQLAEAGRLRVTDSLSRFVDRLRGDKRHITLRQLLDHTSGLPLGAGGGDAFALTREEMLRRVNQIELAAPGTERYSNLGYALLAYIVERLSRQPFDRYVADRILQPTGLRETGTYLPNFDRARIAHGYQGGRDIGVILDMPHDADGHLWSLRGNGGYLSTLSDMHRFYAALLNPSLLREEAHRRAVFGTDGPNVLSGSDLTSFFLFANFPARQVQVFIASNHAEYPGNRLLREIENVLGPGPNPGGDGPRIVTTNNPVGDVSPSTAPLMERLPDNGAGRTVAAYLEAYNSGDTTIMRRFFVEFGAQGTDTPPIDTRLQRYQTMRGNLGQLTFRGWRQAPNGIAVVVTTAQGEQATLTFMLEPEPSNRLRGIQVEVG